MRGPSTVFIMAHSPFNAAIERKDSSYDQTAHSSHAEIKLTIENTAAMCEHIWSIRRVLEDEEFYTALDTITPMLDAVMRPVEE